LIYEALDIKLLQTFHHRNYRTIVKIEHLLLKDVRPAARIDSNPAN